MPQPARLILALLLGAAFAGAPRPAAAFASSCPAPLKLAAGACVRACPGGYEDRGRECVYRNQSARAPHKRSRPPHRKAFKRVSHASPSASATPLG